MYPDTLTRTIFLSIDSFIHPVTRLFIQSSFRPLTILIHFVHPFHHPSTCIRASSHLFFHTPLYMYVYISIILTLIRVWLCLFLSKNFFQFQLQLQFHLHLHFAFTGAVTCASACVFEVVRFLPAASISPGRGRGQGLCTLAHQGEAELFAR